MLIRDVYKHRNRSAETPRWAGRSPKAATIFRLRLSRLRLDLSGRSFLTCFCSPWPVMAKTLLASDAWVLGLLKWMTEPSFLIKLTSSMPGILFTASFFKVDCSFLSSVAAVWWTIFFLRRGVPANGSRSRLVSSRLLTYSFIFANFDIDFGFSHFSPPLCVVPPQAPTFSTDADKLSLSLQLLQLLRIHFNRVSWFFWRSRAFKLSRENEKGI